MEIAKVYEILGRTYAQLCEVAEQEEYWRGEYEETRRSLDTMIAENDRLRKELLKYENLERNNGNHAQGQGADA